MSINYRKDRKVWEARLHYNGKRLYVGSYRTKKLAIAAVESAEKRIARSEKQNIDNYAMGFEPQDSGIAWLRPYRRMKTMMMKRKRERQKDKEVEQKIANM